MKNKFTTIKFDFDISTVDFEQLIKINEPVTSFKISEINSLTKTANFTRYPPKKNNH